MLLRLTVDFVGSFSGLFVRKKHNHFKNVFTVILSLVVSRCDKDTIRTEEFFKICKSVRLVPAANIYTIWKYCLSLFVCNYFNIVSIIDFTNFFHYVSTKFSQNLSIFLIPLSLTEKFNFCNEGKND